MKSLCGNPVVCGQKLISFLYCSYSFNSVHVSSRPCLSSPHVSSASIQSFQYAQLTLHSAVYTHSLHRISHTQQSTYTIYISMVRPTSVTEVCQILEFGFCGCVSRLSLHLRDDHAFEVCYSLSMKAAISSPCAALSSPSILKNCQVVLLELGLGLALVYRVRVRLGVTVSR